ncbi:MAG TPA: OmpH family outer membrane protein [Abditibacteriaceae bacterium]|jgi:Skp family chaperone for outer membrane proteins
MKLSKRSVGLSALLGLCLMTVAPSGAMQQAHAQATPVIGVVDEDKLAERYTAYRDAIAKLDKRAQELDSQLSARELLNDAEGKTFDELIVKATRTPAEQTQLTNLVKIGTDRRAEYMGLLPKATRTDVENARVKSLETQARDNATKLRAISDQLYNDIKKVQEETDKTYTERANNVIAQVAADKKYVVVVRQRAVIWSAPASDITEEVLTRLNKA